MHVKKIKVVCCYIQHTSMLVVCLIYIARDSGMEGIGCRVVSSISNDPLFRRDTIILSVVIQMCAYLTASSVTWQRFHFSNSLHNRQLGTGVYPPLL